MKRGYSVLPLLVVLATAGAADSGKLLKRLDSGDSTERIEALRELGSVDPALARERAVQWLASQPEPGLRAAAARVLWDMKDAARPAEAALRGALTDSDEDTVYNAIGALDGLGVPDQELRDSRITLAQQGSDPFHVFYAARALYPDSALSLTQYLDACFGVANLIAEGGIDNTFTVGALRDDLFGQLGVLAKEQGQAGFDALVEAWPRESPPVRYQISRVLSATPTDVGDPVRIAALLDTAPDDARSFVVSALGAYGAKAQPVLDVIIGHLGPEHEPDLRRTAASTLGSVADVPGDLDGMRKSGMWRDEVETRIAPALAKSVADDADAEVRKASAESLEKLKLWGAPAAPGIAGHIAAQTDLWARYALVHVCLWGARGDHPCARATLQAIADGDPDDAVRRDAREALLGKPET